MKIKFDENDVELSLTFKNKDKIFSSFEETLQAKEKAQISSTQEAIIFFDKYKHIYKHIYKNKSEDYIKSSKKQFKYILKDLIDTFPLTNERKLKIHLIRNGVIPFSIKFFLMYLLTSGIYLTLALIGGVSYILIGITLLSILLIYNIYV